MSRRATALFLLLITVMFTIRPAVAMHYCMGEVHSFNLYQYQEDQLACAEHAEEVEVEAAFFSLNEFQAENTFSGMQSGCCDDTFLELTTDAYGSQAKPLIARVLSSPVLDGVLFAAYLPNQLAMEAELLPSPIEFPPKGYFLKDIDLLTYICIYRI